MLVSAFLDMLSPVPQNLGANHRLFLSLSVGAVYSQTEVALHQATITLPSLGLASTINQGGSICANWYAF